MASPAFAPVGGCAFPNRRLSCSCICRTDLFTNKGYWCVLETALTDFLDTSAVTVGVCVLHGVACTYVQQFSTVLCNVV